MSVLAGQLKSGTGEEFVDTFLSEVSAEVTQGNPTKTLATEPKEFAGYPVTYFSSFVAVEGYTHAEGPTVLIAFLEPWTGTDDLQDVFTVILLNLYGQGESVDTYPLGQGNYTTASDPGWVFFRTPASGGHFNSCGIGPNGDLAGCDVVPSEAPEGTNETVVTPGEPARYRHSETPTFVRDVDTLPEGHRLQNGGTRCAVGHQGTVNCETARGEHGFVVAHYGILW